jgi:hypothetical protein
MKITSASLVGIWAIIFLSFIVYTILFGVTAAKIRTYMQNVKDFPKTDPRNETVTELSDILQKEKNVSYVATIAFSGGLILLALMVGGAILSSGL